MDKIKEISALEILDSRGNPTLEVEVVFENQNGETKKAWESVPSGASTGDFEAYELRDGDKERYGGKGVLKAISNVETIISEALKGKDVTNQTEIDQIMIDLDGTSNKKSLGANAILGVSMAVARAGAIAKDMPLYKYIEELAQKERPETKSSIPRAYFNIINGGMHAGNKIAFQEFMICPNLGTFAKNYQASSEVYQTLKSILKKDFGGASTLLGDEGGFAPNDFTDAKEALDKIVEAIEKAGYAGKVDIALDVAASEFYKNDKYDLGIKTGVEDIKSGEEMVKIYEELMDNYPIISIEDPFDQTDFESFAQLTAIAKTKNVQVVGDDLTVTNTERIQEAIDKKSCDALLLKINQIGTITEAIKAFAMAKADNWEVMVSHRSGETTSDFIADFVVGTGSGQIKSGATARGERVVKYNRILAIEKRF